ncbi:MAG: Tol biopolymer transport system component [Lysobacterales bacterium]|jgi:Tol biopolymer transport system component
MKTTSHSLTVLIAMLFCAADVSAQSRVDAPMVLEKASHARMVEGDLSQAISLYRQVAMSATASRQHVARALVELGSAYELQGSPEAVPAYERVVSEFSDQPTSFMVANSKLNALSASTSAAPEAGARVSGANYTVVSEQMFNTHLDTVRSYDFSPDGTKLINVLKATDGRKRLFPNLRSEAYLRDTNGSVGQPLIKDAADWEYINHARWSPNGKYVLYSQSKHMSKQDGVQQFMLLNTETQESRQFSGDFLNFNMRYRGAEWMPDSNGVIFQAQDGFRIVSLDGVVKKEFLSNVDHMTALGQVSPDGRFMLYHRVTEDKEDHSEMDIWQLNLESGETTRLTQDDGYEGWPVWSADGTQIYYVSGPEVARNVYRRKHGSDESPVQITTFSNASAFYPRISRHGGQLSFALITDNHRVFAAASNNMEAAHAVVRGSGPMLSPDGQSVYYLDRQPGRVGLWKVGANGDNPRKLVPGKILTSYGPNKLLSPDGSKIAYAQYTGDTTTLFVMPSGGGKAISLYSADGVRHLIPSWSPDGHEVAFTIDGDLMVIPANGGDAMVLAAVKNWESWSLEWSPDGKFIAGFAYLEGEESNHIMKVDRALKEVTRVTPPEEDQYKEILAWHPDGDRISYMYYNTIDNNGSRIVNLKTSRISDLANMPDPYWDYIGIWGPDKRYYFLSGPRGYGNSGLYAVEEGSQDYQVIRKTPLGNGALPSWSADGSLMVWSEKEPVRQIWMMTDYE